MAKRPAEDDEDEAPKVRKRRYNPPKKADDDEDAGPPGKNKGKPQEDDEDDEDGEGSISTGIVALDIALDFRDDCIDWSKAHLLYAIIIGVVAFLIISATVFFSINAFLRYLNRPSLETVIRVYDLGLFPETFFFADEALRYISFRNPEVRSPFIFLKGAAFCAIAERVNPADKRDYYLTAANYLQEASQYNFLPSRAAEGWFLLGKSLFHVGELERCKLPLQLALDEGHPHTKEIHWYLAHAYFLGAAPDDLRLANLRLAKEHLRRYQNEPTALEEEIAESRLLETLIVLHTEGIEAAEEILTKGTPRFRQFDVMRNFVEGQIEFFKAREYRQLAMDYETDPNPSLLQEQQTGHSRPSTAPAPVSPVNPTVPETTSPQDVPTVPVPVFPMDDATLRQFMVPDKPPVPVLGVFDGTLEIQQRFAEMRAIYAQNMNDDEIIVLPKESTQQAPVPPPPSQETAVDPFGGDPILKRAWELRESAAGHYRKAIERFVEVTRLANLHDQWGRAARLLTGICYMEMGDLKTAEDYFRRLIDTFPASSEAVAAGFLLGEQDRMKGNSDAALRSFARAFVTLRQNPNYTSHWLTKEEILNRSLKMARDDIEKQKYAETIKFLDASVGVIPARDIARLRGEAYESWAALLRSQAEVTFGERGDQLAKEAESKWRSAGTAFATLAQLRSDALEFSDLLWRGAENYRIGKDFRRAVIEYRKFTRMNLTSRRPEVHLRLGEMYLHLDILDEATYVLEEALRDYPAHFLMPQIRLVLSYVYSEQKEWEKAKTLLKLNLVGNDEPSSGPYRDSMYALGKISYTQGDYDSAVPYLEDAIKVHPNAIQAADAHYLLALAHMGQAEKQLSELAGNPPEATRRSLTSLVFMNRQRALSYLEQAESILTDRQRALGLTEAEKLMLRNTQFKTCVVYMDLERYDLAAPRLNTVATMYHDRVEALNALSKLAFCQRMLGNKTESQMTLRQAEVILNQLEQNGLITDGTYWRNVIQGTVSE